jgi:hypothetical protein
MIFDLRSDFTARSWVMSEEVLDYREVTSGFHRTGFPPFGRISFRELIRGIAVAYKSKRAIVDEFHNRVKEITEYSRPLLAKAIGDIIDEDRFLLTDRLMTDLPYHQASQETNTMTQSRTLIRRRRLHDCRPEPASLFFPHLRNPHGPRDPAGKRAGTARTNRGGAFSAPAVSRKTVQ